MITDGEAKKAARTLMEYCEEHQCKSCCFCSSDDECYLDYYAPIDWYFHD